jgi:hypothetical protein
VVFPVKNSNKSPTGFVPNFTMPLPRMAAACNTSALLCLFETVPPGLVLEHTDSALLLTQVLAVACAHVPWLFGSAFVAV